MNVRTCWAAGLALGLLAGCKGSSDPGTNGSAIESRALLWVDTQPENSLALDDSLFNVALVDERFALSTSSLAADIHSHYVDEGSSDWQSYEFRGRLRMTARNAGIGVTFLSAYPERDAYYRLGRRDDSSFAVSPHGTEITGGNTESGVFADPDVWYEFSVRVADTGSATTIQASVWPAGDPEPAEWQIDCRDASPTRLSRGTVGCWSMADGQKLWADFEIDGEPIPLLDGFALDLEADRTSLEVGDAAEIRVFARSAAERVDVTAEATFEVSSPGILRIAPGLDARLAVSAIALDEGESTVRAVFDGTKSPLLSLSVRTPVPQPAPEEPASPPAEPEPAEPEPAEPEPAEPEPPAAEPPSGGSSGEPVVVAEDDVTTETTWASSVTRFGITWSFDRDYEVGRFVNGDWWVLGPVHIESVSPGWDGTHNGSMIDPRYGAKHGYDARFQFDASLRASFPRMVSANSSVVSVVSWKTGEKGSPEAKSTLKGVPRPAFRRAAVLTVLSAPPPPDAFRPSYAGTDKRIFRERDVAIDALPNLAPVGATPTVDEMLARFENVWLDHLDKWVTRYFCPSENLANYGREIAVNFNTGSLLLLLDLPPAEKKQLARRLVQIGIDYYGVLETGGTWGENGGGLGSGRKWPILFAGYLLDDDDMLAIGFDYEPGSAQEDCQTFYLTADRARNFPGRKVGDAVWAEHGCWNPGGHYHEPGNTGYQWCCTGNAWVGAVLACRILGLEELWNHPPLFDYEDWYMRQHPKGDWQRSWSQFAENLWDSYRAEY